ncbi:MAG: VanZ family protein [Chlorobiaceae bacterium]|nr:VanZ family protein [Chlorobiaceae bacterium]
MKHTKRLLAIEARLLLFLSVIYINIRSLAPGICEYGFTWPDKIEHLFAFLVLSLLLDFAFPERPFSLHKISLLLLYGAGIELAQHFIHFRDCDIVDFIADVLGIILYQFFIPILIRMPVLKFRWNREA